MTAILLIAYKRQQINSQTGHKRKECISTLIRPVMVYGNSTDEIVIRVNDKDLENVKHYKYLGVILDPQLNFATQVDYAVGKANRATAKIGTLIDGRNGLSV